VKIGGLLWFFQSAPNTLRRNISQQVNNLRTDIFRPEMPGHVLSDHPKLIHLGKKYLSLIRHTEGINLTWIL
jgi:hypothetical protein